MFKLTTLLLITLSLFAQTEMNDLSLNTGKRYKFTSKHMNQDRTIKVRLPPRYNANNTYPVVYLLDGDWNHDWVTSLVHRFESIRRIPNSIIVSFENVNRGKDLIQNPEPFRSFIVKEIKTWVEKTYSTKDYSLFIGHSLAGAFTLEIMSKYPETFDNFLAISPVFPTEEVYSRITNSLKEVKNTDSFLYFTLGKEDPTNTDRLQSLLKKSSMSWNYDYFPHDDHMSVPLTSVTKMMSLHYRIGMRYIESGEMEKGLRIVQKLGDGWKNHYLNESFTNLITDKKHKIASKLFNILKEESNSPSIYYLNAKLSKEMGDIDTEKRMWEKIDQLSEDMKTLNLQRDFNQFSYRLIREGQSQKAIHYFKKLVENYPSSPNSYDSLGDGYRNAGMNKKAIELYSKAYELAKKQSDPNVARYEQRLKRFKSVLK